MKTFRRFYHSRIIDHYENPRNVGSFPKRTRHIIGKEAEDKIYNLWWVENG